MNEVLHANIFFFIASIATVAFCILVCLILYHVLKITQSIRVIMSRIEAQSGQIVEDIDAVRDFVRQGSIIRMVIGLFGGSRRQRKKASDDET